LFISYYLPQVGHLSDFAADLGAGEEEAALPNLGRPNPTIEI
jgi:hypothetical protein